ncbi:MAG TPA: hypothetical protein VGX68_23770 [Thermoanaerobaculia bacterium]|jgi:hypothetical protein|nr:hypothetical protein [Thermoanaerobaculia bacterium]
MEDHRLGDLLRELPREQARPDFTTRVLERLDTPKPAPRPRAGLLLAAATAVAMLVGVWTGVRIDRQREASEAARAQQILQDLRAEHGRLERELREMSQPPVVYIGGNEDVDLVLDLGKVRAAEGATPAAYHGETF